MRRVLFLLFLLFLSAELFAQARIVKRGKTVGNTVIITNQPDEVTLTDVASKLEIKSNYLSSFLKSPLNAVLTVTSDSTANQLFVQYGDSIKVPSAGDTLTINNLFAGDYKIFGSGSGTVMVGNSVVNPHWWGITTGRSQSQAVRTANKNAIQSAINAAQVGAVVRLPACPDTLELYYSNKDSISVNRNIRVIGSSLDRSSTVLSTFPKDSASGIAYHAFFIESGVSGAFFDFTLVGPNQFNIANIDDMPRIYGIWYDLNTVNVDLRNLKIAGQYITAIYTPNIGTWSSVDLDVTALEVGITIYGALPTPAVLTRVYVHDIVTWRNLNPSQPGGVGIYIHEYIPFIMDGCLFKNINSYDVQHFGDTPTTDPIISKFVNCQFIVDSDTMLTSLQGGRVWTTDNDGTTEFVNCKFYDVTASSVNNNVDFVGCTWVSTNGAVYVTRSDTFTVGLYGNRFYVSGQNPVIWDNGHTGVTIISQSNHYIKNDNTNYSVGTNAFIAMQTGRRLIVDGDSYFGNGSINTAIYLDSVEADINNVFADSLEQYVVNVVDAPVGKTISINGLRVHRHPTDDVVNIGTDAVSGSIIGGDWSYGGPIVGNSANWYGIVPTVGEDTVFVASAPIITLNFNHDTYLVTGTIEVDSIGISNHTNAINAFAGKVTLVSGGGAVPLGTTGNIATVDTIAVNTAMTLVHRPSSPGWYIVK